MINREKSVFWGVVTYSFYFFIASFPFINYVGFLYSGTFTRAINVLIFSTVLGLALSVWMFNKKTILLLPKSPVFYSLIIYLIFLFISAFQGLSFATSFWSLITRMTGLWYFLNLGFLMVILWQVLLDKNHQMKMILTVILSTSLYSILSLMGPEGLGFLFKGYPFDGFTFGNSTFAGMYIFGAFVLASYYLIQHSNKKWWMYILPIILIINPNIINREVWFGNFTNGFVGEARASAYVVVLFIFGMLVVWGISKIKNHKYKVTISYSSFVLGLLLIISSAFSLVSSDGFLNKIYLSQATAVRPLVWSMSLEAVKQKLLLGWGSDNFERVFEKNYDNRILQQEYGNEAWLDRAHNLFIDLLVDNGFVGLILYLIVYCVIILSLLYSIFNSKERADVILSAFLVIYFPLHIIELQTAFDTSISYVMLAIMTVLVSVIFHRTYTQAKGHDLVFVIKDGFKYFSASVLFGLFVGSLVAAVFPLVNAQVANGELRQVGSSEKRIALYPTLLGSRVDKHSFLWRTMTDFERGIAEDPSVLSDPKKVEYFKQEMVIFEAEYKDFLQQNPNNFRAHLSLANVLIYYRLFGVDKLADAQEILDQAIVLVPQSPQPYWMKAVAYVYMGKFDLAREYANKGLVLNPKIKQSQDIVDYVESSSKTFPEIDLFFFPQI